MYRLVLELNENCYQHLVLDTKLLGNDINKNDDDIFMPCFKINKDTEKNNLSLSKDEIDLIKKYRELPYEGKTTVKAILKSQYDLYVKPKSDEKAI